MKHKNRSALRRAIFASGIAACACALAAPARPWSDAGQSPDARARALVGQLTEAEKFQLIHGVFAQPDQAHNWPMPAGAIGSAGYVPGIPRLDIPGQQQSDAGLGVANPVNVRTGDVATALPSGLATASRHRSAGFCRAIAWARAFGDRHGAVGGGAQQDRGGQEQG